MAIMEISIFPIGTPTTSLSAYVAKAVAVVKREKGISYQLTPMGTVIEAQSVATLMRLAEKMHRAVARTGCKRIYMHFKLDDRRDKKATMRGKIESVERKML